MPDIVCGRLLLGCFCVELGGQGSQVRRLAFLVAMVIVGLCSGLELAGYSGSPLRPRQPPPLDCLLPAGVPCLLLVLADQGGGAGTLSLSVLGGALGPGDMSLPGG